MRYSQIFLCVLLSVVPVVAQQGLTLDECQRRARTTYPLSRQLPLIEASRQYSIENAARGLLPQVTVTAQASYQSDVTQIPITIPLPGFTIEPPSRDQYRIVADVQQTVYDGGTTGTQRRMADLSATADQQSVDVELRRLRERIDQLFFGIVMVDAQILQLDITRTDIDTALKVMEGAVANGAMLRSNQQMLRADRLQLEQRSIDLQATRRAYAAMLQRFTGLAITDTTTFVAPDAGITDAPLTRPELALFDTRMALTDLQSEAVAGRSRPRFGLFAQAGFGRPALNMLSNTFDPYYVAGIRLSWSLTGLYADGGEHEVLHLQKTSIGLQQETFRLTTDAALDQLREELRKYEAILGLDTEIIALRRSVRTASQVQLANGAISARDYLHDVHLEEQARRQLALHEIQRRMTIHSYRTMAGQ